MLRSTVLRKGPDLAILLALGALVAPAGAEAQGCANAKLKPNNANIEQVRDAVLCLLNQERARHGPAVAARERRAAQRRRPPLARHGPPRFFDHVSPGGATMVDRIRRAGYLAAPAPGRSARTSPGARAASPPPAQIVRSWMQLRRATARTSSTRAFREIGIGIALGRPPLAARSGRHLHDGLRRRR